MPGSGSHNRHQTVPAPSLGLGTGAPPPRVVALGPLRQWLGGGSAPAGAGKVPRASAPACRPACRGIQLTAPGSPGETRSMVVPGVSKGPPCARCSGRCARSAPLLPSPAHQLQPEERPRAPRMGRNCAALLREVAQRGLPKVTRSAPAELPRSFRVESQEVRGGGVVLCPPSSLRLTPSLPPPPPPVLTGLAGDSDDAAPSLGRIIEPRRALNLALKERPPVKPEARCSRASREPRGTDAAA